MRGYIDLKILGLIVFSVSCGVTGQFLFRYGMKQVGPVEFGPGIFQHFLHLPIIAGIACYAIATSSWLVIVSRVPLSLAYPMVSISYVAVVLVGRFALKEYVHPTTWIGVLLIVFGVGIMGVGNAAPSAPPPAEVHQSQ